VRGDLLTLERHARGSGAVAEGPLGALVEVQNPASSRTLARYQTPAALSSDSKATMAMNPRGENR
jgi:hypothetical protein